MPKIRVTDRVMFVAGLFGTLPPQQLLLPVAPFATLSSGRSLPPPLLAPAGAAPGDDPSPTPPSGALFALAQQRVH